MKCEECKGKGFHIDGDGDMPNCHACHGTGEQCCIRINKGPLTAKDLPPNTRATAFVKFGKCNDWFILCVGSDGHFMFDAAVLDYVTAWAVMPKGG